MAILLFNNNATSTLQNAISSGAVSATLAPGTGALFPNPGAGQYFVLTFIDAATGLLNEIVWVTARSGDVLTIVRGQEGTAAQNWNAGDFANNQWTAGSAEAMLQQGQYQQQSANYAEDTGSVNAVTVTLSPAPTSMTQLIGAPVRVKMNHTNTTTSPTLNVNGLGAEPIVTYNSSGVTTVPISGLVEDQIVTFIWDGTNFQVASSGSGSSGGSVRYATAGGSANALTITLSPAPGALSELDGVPIYILATATSTTNSPTLNVNGLGAVIITGWGNTNTSAGVIKNGDIIEVVYDAGSNIYQLISNQVVTSQSGTGSSAKGYIRLPNGTIIQWGNAASATGSNDSISLPVAFPTAYSVVTNSGFSGTPATIPTLINANGGVSLSSFTIYTYLWNGTGWTPTASIGVNWVAIGY